MYSTLKLGMTRSMMTKTHNTCLVNASQDHLTNIFIVHEDNSYYVYKAIHCTSPCMNIVIVSSIIETWVINTECMHAQVYQNDFSIVYLQNDSR